MDSVLYVGTLAGLGYALLALLILIHELGHAIAYRLISPKRVVVWVGRSGPGVNFRFADFDLRFHLLLNGGLCGSDKRGLTVAQLRRILYGGPLASAFGSIAFGVLAINTRGLDPPVWKLFAGAAVASFLLAFGSTEAARPNKADDGERARRMRHIPRDTIIHSPLVALARERDAGRSTPSPPHIRRQVSGRRRHLFAESDFRFASLDRIRQRRQRRKMQRHLAFADALAHELTIAPGPGSRPGEHLQVPSRSMFETQLARNGERKDFLVIVGQGCSSLVAFCLGEIGKLGDAKDYATRRSARIGEEGYPLASEVVLDQVGSQPAFRIRYLLIQGTRTEWFFECDGWLFMARLLSRHPDRETDTRARARQILATWQWLPGSR